MQKGEMFCLRQDDILHSTSTSTTTFLKLSSARKAALSLDCTFFTNREEFIETSKRILKHLRPGWERDAGFFSALELYASRLLALCAIRGYRPHVNCRLPSRRAVQTPFSLLTFACTHACATRAIAAVTARTVTSSPWLPSHMHTQVGSRTGLNWWHLKSSPRLFIRCYPLISHFTNNTHASMYQRDKNRLTTSAIMGLLQDHHLRVDRRPSRMDSNLCDANHAPLVKQGYVLMSHGRVMVASIEHATAVLHCIHNPYPCANRSYV
eukprot:6196206-Pleurochrysis_carterae.AAC.5